MDAIATDYIRETRVGKYVWPIDMANMSQEELDALIDGAKHYRDVRRVDFWENVLEKLIKDAAKDGVQLCVTNLIEDDDYVLHAMNVYAAKA